MLGFLKFLEEDAATDDPYLYHGTRGEYVPSITKRGILTGKAAHRNNWEGFSNRRKVYLIADKDDAMSWARWGWRQQKPSSNHQSIRVLRIVKDKLNPHKIVRDKNGIAKAVEYKGNIPRSAIDWKGKGLHGKGWPGV